jgi:hypothetical protein
VTGHLNGAMHDSYSEEFISDFIKTFEVNKKTKTDKAATSKAKSAKVPKKKSVCILEEFMEPDDSNPIAS